MIALLLACLFLFTTIAIQSLAHLTCSPLLLPLLIFFPKPYALPSFPQQEHALLPFLLASQQSVPVLSILLLQALLAFPLMTYSNYLYSKLQVFQAEIAYF